MTYGYNGKILRVDLTQRTFQVDSPEEKFYRGYLGGRGFISYYLLRELKPGTDPLGPDNELIFAASVITGAPVGGFGRNSVGAKSPLTGGYGDAQVGGFWGAELKHAGYDAIIVQGRADQPVYLWIKDGQVEIRDARHLWGKTTGECDAAICAELGDTRVRTAAIGPAGEKLVRYAAIINDLAHAAGRTGMGAVMGSKNLKAIAVRGTNPPPMANPPAVASLARWLKESVPKTMKAFRDEGTASGLTAINRAGGLPTRNFQGGGFEGAEKISGTTMKQTILVGRKSCYYCPVGCKRKVSVSQPYHVDAAYGGPEYETLAAFGSNCGIDDLAAIAKAHEICNAYGLDTISTGDVIAFAMECFENGILSRKDLDGLELRFGNAAAMVTLAERIARREGVGDLLAEGVLRAARKIGNGAEQFAMHVKGQEIPMHEPRYKHGLGLGYALSPTGADHNHNIHDSYFAREGYALRELRALGPFDPLPLNDLSAAKVRLLLYRLAWSHLLDCLNFCIFVPFGYEQVADVVRGVTGWNATLWELMKAGERAHCMARLFNLREGSRKEDDFLPDRFFTPLRSGSLAGTAIDRQSYSEARDLFYSMAGWDTMNGTPLPAKLHELDIAWAADYVGHRE
ncbi:MAG: aldehyde ferredoxin oxidoreductase family protein [Chloroflexota bacterium]